MFRPRGMPFARSQLLVLAVCLTPVFVSAQSAAETADATLPAVASPVVARADLHTSVR